MESVRGIKKQNYGTDRSSNLGTATDQPLIIKIGISGCRVVSSEWFPGCSI